MSRKRHPRLPLGRLRHNLGGRPTLMSLRSGAKNKGGRWAECQSDNALRRGNVAVIQGNTYRSPQGGPTFDCGGVWSVDCDGDKSGKTISGQAVANEFLRLNPAAKWSFRTAGNNGCNVHFIANCKLPSVSDLHTDDGVKVGELRTGGCYTLVAGRHPDGVPYKTIVDAPAFHLNPQDLRWLDGRNLIEHIQYRKALKRRERELSCSKYTQDDAKSLVCSISKPTAFQTALHLLANHLPTSTNQTDTLHWNLAGELLGLGIQLTPPEILNLGRHWYDISEKHFLKRNESREQYARQMLHKFKSRRFPTGKGEGTFTAALEAAGIEDAPDLAVECFPHSKDIQFAATLCRELARRTANGVFFLSARDLQSVLELGSPKTANDIIHTLRDIGLIAPHQIFSRARRKATEYKYLADDLQPQIEVMPSTSEVAA